MKAVMISIQPKWCEKIAGGEKTIEVRKTRPKLEPPFKCYIYRTKGSVKHLINDKWVNVAVGGTVIGEFVCDCIEEHHQHIHAPINELEEVELFTVLELSCLTYPELANYTKNQEHYKPFYGWLISDLVLYDKPKELGEFKVRKTNDVWSCLKRLERPPQSWCYVEEGD